MRQLVVFATVLLLMDFTDGRQYPDCVTCSHGSIPLSPLSYNTVRSNVFNGTQPSNEGCTNGATINEQVTINCGQGTTLTNCDRGVNVNNDVGFSSYFIWNRTISVAGQVSIVFRFYQPINISRISLFFWNSPSNSIIVPNVMMYWSNDDSITPSNEISITTSSVRRTSDARRKLNIINDNWLQFQYLRIIMSFYDDSEWIFLGEVQFCGNTAPYHITHPSTDNDVQIVSPTAIMASLICSLNVTIPSSVTVMWLHNGSAVMVTPPNGMSKVNNIATLQIRDLQPSDAGVYQCVFNETDGYILQRSINLLIIDVQITHPPVDLFKVTFNVLTTSVSLTCSLNIDIPSSVTVTWFYNSAFTITLPNEVTQVNNSATLLLRDPEASDAGIYECNFIGLSLRRLFNLEFQDITIITSISTSTFTVINVASSTSSHLITESDHRTVTITSINSPTAVTTNIFTDINNSTTTASVISSVYLIGSNTTTTSTSTNTNLPTFDNEKSSSSSIGVIVAIVALVVVVFIIITVVVVGIIVVWERKKSQQQTKPSEDVYYSTIDETLPKSPPKQPEPDYIEMKDEQDNQEADHEYVDISEDVQYSFKQASKFTMQDNPSYFISSENQLGEITPHPTLSHMVTFTTFDEVK